MKTKKKKKKKKGKTVNRRHIHMLSSRRI
jgi:hypothetical protein